jgi:hypothetical protein
MFNAMQDSLNNAKEEFNKKFEIKERSVKKSFSFGQSQPVVSNVEETSNNEENTVENV